MSDTLPTGEEEEVELDAPEPEALASELGLELSDEERAEAEEMVARLKTKFGLDEVAQEEPEPEPSEPEEEEPEPEPEADQPVEADAWITIDGKAVPVAEARSMLELRQYLAANPDKAEKVRAAIEDPQPEPEPEPQPPDFIDLDDPSQRFMWEQFKAQNQQIVGLQKTLSTQQANQARQSALNEVHQAMTTFRNNHPELTEEDVQTVRVHAVALNIIPGLQSQMSGSDAVLKALDLAYWDHPEFRAKATGQPSPKDIKESESKVRKQKLAGIAGSTVSATREPAAQKRPESDREMRQMAAEWLDRQQGNL